MWEGIVPPPLLILAFGVSDTPLICTFSCQNACPALFDSVLSEFFRNNSIVIHLRKGLVSSQNNILVISFIVYYYIGHFVNILMKYDIDENLSKRVTRNGDVNNHIAEHHFQTRHQNTGTLRHVLCILQTTILSTTYFRKLAY